MLKKFLLILVIMSAVSIQTVQSQGLKNLAKKAKSLSSSNSGLSADEVGRGLKEALSQGVDKGVTQLSKPNGYFGDAAIKILLPPEARKIESKLRSIGQGKLVDDAIASMNAAAEDAAKEASEIFLNAIKAMTIEDAFNILRGDDNAATVYLDRVTRSDISNRFLPIIKVSLEKVGATKHWKTMITAHNKIPFVKKINPNLEEHVTEKAIDGLFVQVAKEEKQIRDNPGARTTDLLKKVFSN